MLIPYFCDDDNWNRFYAELSTWLGTPYVHYQKTKGYGVDCTMLAGQVMVDVGILDKLSYEYYSKDWHLHTKDPIVENSIVLNMNSNVSDTSLVLKKILRNDGDWVRGDFLLMGVVSPDISNHMAILLDNGEKMIHAFGKRGVIEDFYSIPWRKRTRYKVRLYKEVS